MNTSEILIYQNQNGHIKIDVRLEDETVWLTQDQMATLFGKGRSTITEHISNVFSEGELMEDMVCRKFRHTTQHGAIEGKTQEKEVKYYNLDVIISVGYRVRSGVATRFRIWATERLREYLIKGFTMDDAKLKELGGGRYWRELLERIRDIRSSEKVLYRQVLDLYATSLDYDPKAGETVRFFQIVQNKLHYAAHGRTAAEVIDARADAGKPHMGLTSFAGERPRKADVGVAKNYLDERELAKLNTIVSAFFDAAEFRAQNQQHTRMRDWLGHLDRLIGAMDAPMLTDAGSVSHRQAMQKAEAEYERYRERVDAAPSDVERAYLDSLKRTQRTLEKGKP